MPDSWEPGGSGSGPLTMKSWPPSFDVGRPSASTPNVQPLSGLHEAFAESLRSATLVNAAMPRSALVDYVNWRGERRWRRIQPVAVVHGWNEWHPTPQWLMVALDLEQPFHDELQTFALSGIKEWRTVE